MMYEHMILEHKMKSELQDVADHNFKTDQRIEKLDKIVSELKQNVSMLVDIFFLGVCCFGVKRWLKHIDI